MTPAAGTLAAIDALHGPPSGAADPWPSLAALERLLARSRDRTTLTLVEFAPASVSRERTWHAYFPRARIVAVRPAWPVEPPPADLAPRLLRRGGNQNDDDLLGRLLAPDRPDIVLDAGANPRWHQLAAIAALFPAMPAGGVYLVADRPTEGGETLPSGAAFTPQRCIRHAARLKEADEAAAPGRSPIEALAGLIARCSETILVEPGLLALRRNDLRVAEAYRTLPLAEAADRLREMETGGSYLRLPAEILDCPAWLMRRFEAAAAPPGREVPAFPGLVGMLRGAVVHGRGVVTTRRGALVQESLINAHQEASAAGLLKLEAGRRYLDPAPRPPPRQLAGPSPRVLLKQAWDNNYGHWLVESLPRLALVERAGWLAPDSRCIVQEEAGPMRQVYLDSLAFFGIGEDRVDFTTGETVEVETLVYPAPLTRQPWAKAPCVVALLERFPEFAARRLAAAAPNAPERIFVARSPGHSRQLLNQDEVIELLRPRGFAVVAPERLGFWEQVATFSRAEIVVGVLGAGMANLVFAPPGVTCIALTTELMGDDFFYDIVCHKRGRYVSIHGKATDPRLGMSSDFTVETGRLAPYLP
jgi:capsular polysaccharide biosynthesis protein